MVEPRSYARLRGRIPINGAPALRFGAPPDGYTLASASMATLCVVPHLYAKIGYDSLKDFAPVTIVAAGPFMFVVHPSLPVRNLKELIALQGGETALMYDPVLTSLPHVKAGRVRMLALGAAKRTPLLPDLPTVAEAGLPGFEATSWFGLVAPAATPRDIIARLNAALVKTIGDKDVAQRLSSQGLEPVLNTPEQFAEVIRQDLPRWGKVVKAAGIKAE